MLLSLLCLIVIMFSKDIIIRHVEFLKEVLAILDIKPYLISYSAFRVAFVEDVAYGYYRGEDSGAYYPELETTPIAVYDLKATDINCGYYEYSVLEQIRFLFNTGMTYIDSDYILVSYLINNPQLIVDAPAPWFPHLCEVITQYATLDFSILPNNTMGVVQDNIIVAEYNITNISDLPYKSRKSINLFANNRQTESSSSYPVYLNFKLINILLSNPHLLRNRIEGFDNFALFNTLLPDLVDTLFLKGFDWENWAR